MLLTNIGNMVACEHVQHNDKDIGINTAQLYGFFFSDCLCNRRPFLLMLYGKNDVVPVPSSHQGSHNQANIQHDTQKPAPDCQQKDNDRRQQEADGKIDILVPAGSKIYLIRQKSAVQHAIIPVQHPGIHKGDKGGDTKAYSQYKPQTWAAQ